MSRLQTQRWRLYSPTLAVAGSPSDGAPEFPLIDEQGEVRAMVLEFARPADWAMVARVWHGVQDDLHLPAPAIAVNGVNGYQLWFSVSAKIPAADGQAFLGLLRARFSADIPVEQVSWKPSPSAAGAAHQWQHADPVPAPTRMAGQWSAFVTRDLAPVFNDSPWLDIPPNPEGQADLLTPLRSLERDDLRALLSRAAPASLPAVRPSAGTDTPPSPQQDPRHFLLGVMNDPGVDLALRIEAAKALLPHGQPSAATG